MMGKGYNENIQGKSKKVRVRFIFFKSALHVIGGIPCVFIKKKIYGILENGRVAIFGITLSQHGILHLPPYPSQVLNDNFKL